MAQIMGKKRKIRGNMTPNPNWELVELYRGSPVYREKKQNLRLVPMKGPDGGEVWIKDQRTQVPIKQKMVWEPDPSEPFIWDEFQLQDLGNGMVMKNRHFRKPPGEEYHDDSPAPSYDELSAKVKDLEEVVMSFIKGDVVEEGEVESALSGDESDPDVVLPPFGFDEA